MEIIRLRVISIKWHDIQKTLKASVSQDITQISSPFLYFFLCLLPLPANDSELSQGKENGNKSKSIEVNWMLIPTPQNHSVDIKSHTDVKK